MKIYIAGPMSGYPNFNFKAFFLAQGLLEAGGWTVFNPAAKNIQDCPDIAKNVSGDTALAAIQNGFDLREALAWDTARICESDAIYMLRGWEHSPGARAEWSLAQCLQKHFGDKMQIIYQ